MYSRPHADASIGALFRSKSRETPRQCLRSPRPRLRVAIAATALTVMMQLPMPALQQKNPLNMRTVMVTALSGFLALAVGMTLLLFALSGGNVGIVSSLSATSPVIILPLIWMRTGQRPSAGAWVGAAIVIVGMALIFTR